MSKHARVVRNILALLLNQVGTWGITFVLTLVIPRYLGAQMYGLYAFVGAYAAFFGIAISLGTGTYLTWRIAREPHVAGQLTFNTLLLQLPLCVTCTIAALLLMPLMDGTPLTLHLTVVSMAAVCIGALIATCSAGLAGLQIMRAPAVITLVGSGLGAGAMIVGAQLHADVLVLTACGLGGQVLSLVAMLIYTQSKLHMRPNLELRLWKTIVLGGMPFFAWSAVLLWYGQIDVTLLKILVGNTEVGWYAAANRIVGIPIFLPTVVVAAILPALSHERVPSPHFRAMASRCIRLVMLVGIPAACGTILLSNHIDYLLRFPASFNQIAPVIVILGLNMPLVGLDMVLGTVLIAVGRQKAWTVVGIVSAIFNPVANLWAIPYAQHQYGNGAIGAATVTLATEVLMLIGALILRPRSVFTGSDVWYVLRCLIASAVMIPAVLALASWGTFSLIWAISYGVIAFATAAYTLQLITNNDILAVLSLVKAKMGLGEEPVDGRQVMQGMRGILAAAQGSAATALGRAGTVSRPLSALIRSASAISQPLASAARETAHRLGGAISHPHAGHSTVDSASVVAGEIGHGPGGNGHGNGNGHSNGHSNGDLDPLAIPPWDIAQFETAPLNPSALVPSSGRMATNNGRPINEDERETTPVVRAARDDGSSAERKDQIRDRGVLHTHR